MKVTVIIAPTNPHVDLRPAVESLLAQTFSDFEIIVVGGSIELSDPRIKFIQNEKKSARNVGLEHARGDYIYFMDADGLIFENAFELLIDAAERSNADIVHSSSYVERDGDDVSIVPSSVHSPIGVNLYRREFLERTGVRFPASLDGDEAFCYAASCLTDRIENVEERFYVRARQKEEPLDDRDYVRDLERDEIRSGFLVTSQRKKLWNVQIKLIRELDRVCRKHGLRWYADGGTLLGAVRHRGFIPWDDDVDIDMPRPDFEKFLQVAPTELRPPYCLDTWSDYRLEEEPSEDTSLPMLSNALVHDIREHGWWWPINAGFFKLRDASTCLIQWLDRPHFPQGIWIDIFPLDAMPPFDDEQNRINFEIANELMIAASNRPLILQLLRENYNFVTPLERLKSILKLTYHDRARAFERQMVENYAGNRDHVCWLSSFLRRKHAMDSTIFDKIIQLPFEETTLNAPINFEHELKYYYGDWRELMFSLGHMKACSVDVSDREYFAKISPGLRAQSD